MGFILNKLVIKSVLKFTLSRLNCRFSHENFLLYWNECLLNKGTTWVYFWRMSWFVTSSIMELSKLWWLTGFSHSSLIFVGPKFFPVFYFLGMVSWFEQWIGEAGFLTVCVSSLCLLDSSFVLTLMELSFMLCCWRDCLDVASGNWLSTFYVIYITNFQFIGISYRQSYLPTFRSALSTLL